MTDAPETVQLPEPAPHNPITERLAAMTQPELEMRRKEIVDSAQGKYENLSTEMLQELSFLTAILRRRNAGPPKARPNGKTKVTIDDLI